MKKALSLILALVLCLSLCACGGTTPEQTDNLSAETTTPPQTYYNIGDTVSTNMFNFTLDAAQLTIALSNINDETYCLPKDYDPQADKNNPYVASVGHTFVAFTYTVENISRASNQFHTGSSFVKVLYKDTEYSTTLEDCAYYLYESKQIMNNGKLETIKGNVWHRSAPNNFLLMNAAKETRRAYADIAIETDSLTDAFYLRISIPSSTGYQVFTYQIPASN